MKLATGPHARPVAKFVTIMTRKGRWDDLNEKKRPLLDWLLFFLFCGLLFFGPIFLFFGHDILAINRLKRELQKPSDLHAVALACKVLFEQNAPSKTFYPADFKDLPEVLRSKNPRGVNIRHFENGDG